MAGPRSGDFMRALALALRTAHIAGVVWLGAVLLGAPVGLWPAAIAVLASGAMLFALDLAAGRLRLVDLSGLVVLAKFAAVIWLAADGPARHAVFWSVLVASSLSSHAPKALRHWRPAWAQSRSSRAGRPG